MFLALAKDHLSFSLSQKNQFDPWNIFLQAKVDGMGEDVFSHNDDSNYYSDDEGCFYPKSTDESCTCDHQQENIIKCTTRHSNSHRQSGHNLKNQPPTDRRHRHRCLNGCPHSAMVDEKTSTTSTTLATPLGLNQLGPSSFELNMVGAHDVSARPVDVTQIQFTPDDIEYRGEGNSSIVVSLAKVSTFALLLQLLNISTSKTNGTKFLLHISTQNASILFLILQDAIYFTRINPFSLPFKLSRSFFYYFPCLYKLFSVSLNSFFFFPHRKER